ncbi:MAG: hypothetical protein N4A47_04060 [Clostridia bacterium]|jgi:hypothetical protein|nr:hypothetical protein [Clostridia bacterium]
MWKELEVENFKTVEFYNSNSAVHAGHEAAVNRLENHKKRVNDTWYLKLPIIKGRMRKEEEILASEMKEWESLDENYKMAYSNILEEYEKVRSLAAKGKAELTKSQIMAMRTLTNGALFIFEETNENMSNEVFENGMASTRVQDTRVSELHQNISAAVEVDQKGVIGQSMKKIVNECEVMVDIYEDSGDGNPDFELIGNDVFSCDRH